MLALEVHVDGASTNLPQQRKPELCFTRVSWLISFSLLLIDFSAAEYGPKMESCLKNFLEVLDETVDTFKKALYFLQIKVCHACLGWH